MRKIARRSLIADTLHKGFVCACVGLTLYGTCHLGWRFYRYYTVIRPEQETKDLAMKQSILAEGSSDNLKDSAPQLKL